MLDKLSPELGSLVFSHLDLPSLVSSSLPQTRTHNLSKTSGLHSKLLLWFADPGQAFSTMKPLGAWHLSKDILLNHTVAIFSKFSSYIYPLGSSDSWKRTFMLWHSVLSCSFHFSLTSTFVALGRIYLYILLLSPHCPFLQA